MKLLTIFFSTNTKQASAAKHRHTAGRLQRQQVTNMLIAKSWLCGVKTEGTANSYVQLEAREEINESSIKNCCLLMYDAKHLWKYFRIKSHTIQKGGIDFNTGVKTKSMTDYSTWHFFKENKNYENNCWQHVDTCNALSLLSKTATLSKEI